MNLMRLPDIKIHKAILVLLLGGILLVLNAPNAYASDTSISQHALSSSESWEVLCLGDSITHGAPYAGTSATYPYKLDLLLTSQYGSNALDVVNRGVNGYHADQVLSSLQSQGWLNSNPKYVLLMVGGNDLNDADLGTIDAIIDQTVIEVQQIINYVKSHTNPDGTRPYVIVSAFTPNLVSGLLGSLAVGVYNGRLVDNLTNYDVWFTDNWDDLYDPNTFKAKVSLMADNVHPNQAGYTILSENWYEQILSHSNSKFKKPVYRFWSDTYMHHFYTISAAERDYVISNYPDSVWCYEGVAYSAYSPTGPGSTPVYRFWSDTYMGHFYTSSTAERDHVINNYPDNVWRYEGIAYYVPEGGNSNPSYRFWSDMYMGHFYTSSETEKNNVINNYPDNVWRYEGVAYSVY